MTAPLRRRTLLRHLLVWVLGALAAVWLGYLVIGLRTGVHEADELTDGHLASTASLLLAQTSIQFVTARDASAPTADLKRHDYQQSMSVVVWDAAGRLLSRVGDAPEPPFDSPDGFATLQIGNPPAAWRTFARWDAPDRQQRRVMVMLSIEERDDLAWDIAAQIAQPGFWLLPVIAVVLGLAIRRGLRPLDALSSDVGALDIRAGAALPTGNLHEEFRAVVESINQLSQRYRAAVARERELAGELAHEMRTPLASLALHAQALAGELGEADRRETQAHVARDALRAGEVLQHLLTMARADHTGMVEARTRFDIVPMAARVLADHGQAALDGHHELALTGDASLHVSGYEVLLELALRNLVENALAHAPPESVVDVKVDATARWLEVSNATGAAAPSAAPGAAAPMPSSPGTGVPRLGLGLGHRVVEKVVALHGAAFAEVPADATTRRYRITFGGSEN
ncbi:MAG: histidine kinase dimerization/phospho-acceptor domain-containing protein [Pseudomonadota bacterium]